MNLTYKTFFGTVDVDVDMHNKCIRANGNPVLYKDDLPGKEYDTKLGWLVLLLLLCALVNGLLTYAFNTGVLLHVGFGLSAALAVGGGCVWRIDLCGQSRADVIDTLEWANTWDYHPHTALSKYDAHSLASKMLLAFQITGYPEKELVILNALADSNNRRVLCELCITCEEDYLDARSKT